MSLTFIPGSSALMTTSLSFSKMSTEGFHAVVESGDSQPLPKKSPNRTGSLPNSRLNSRKGSHLMSDTVCLLSEACQRGFLVGHGTLNSAFRYLIAAD